VIYLAKVIERLNHDEGFWKEMIRLEMLLGLKACWVRYPYFV